MDILYEDSHVIAANKPAKLFTHPIDGDPESKNCLLFQVRDHIGQHLYPINRLDRPVSGIVLFAKEALVVSMFQNIWHSDSTRKIYQCLHRGKLEKDGVFNSSLSKLNFSDNTKSDIKQDAITIYRPIQFYSHEFCSFTEVEIKTGRYHQIRRHFRKAVMPIIGDRKHGKGSVNRHFEETYGLDQIFLHCNYLEYICPISATQIIIKSELTPNLRNVLQLLNTNI